MLFFMCRQQYGNPIICLNLCRQTTGRGREDILSTQYANAVSNINKSTSAEERIELHSWDMRENLRELGSQILSKLQNFQRPLLQKTGYFALSHDTLILQKGVLRTNCVDCLDRTNVAQFSFGLLVLEDQLHSLGLVPPGALDPRSSMATVLVKLYESMGDALAHQYGGSNAHSGFFQRWRGDWSASRQSKDFLTTLKRFYSNAVTDDDKQQAIDLFLGRKLIEKEKKTMSAGFADACSNMAVPGRSRLSDRSAMWEATRNETNECSSEEEYSCETEDARRLKGHFCPRTVSLDSCYEEELISLPKLLSSSSLETKDEEINLDNKSEESHAPAPRLSADIENLSWKEYLKRLTSNARRPQQSTTKLESLDEVMPMNIQKVRITAPSPPPASTLSWLTPSKTAKKRPSEGLRIRTRSAYEGNESPYSSPASFHHESSRWNSPIKSNASVSVPPLSMSEYYAIAGLDLEGANFEHTSLTPRLAPISARSSADDEKMSRRGKGSRIKRVDGVWSPTSRAQQAPTGRMHGSPNHHRAANHSNILSLEKFIAQQQDPDIAVKRMGIPVRAMPYWSSDAHLPAPHMISGASPVDVVLSSPWTPAQYKALESLTDDQLTPYFEIL